MKTVNKIIAFAFVLMVVLAPVVACGWSDGEGPTVDSGNVKVNSFDDMGGGSIEVPITGATNGQSITVKVKSEDGSRVWATTTVTANSEGKAVAKLSWNFDSSGDKTVYIWLNDVKADDGGIKIHSGHSIWKDPLTYVAIVVVVILIIIAIYIKMRGLPGKKKDKKNDKTFTQIEEERKAGEKKSFFKKEESAPAEIKDDTTSTEKQEYTPGKGFFRKKQ